MCCEHKNNCISGISKKNNHQYKFSYTNEPVTLIYKRGILMNNNKEEIGKYKKGIANKNSKRINAYQKKRQFKLKYNINALDKFDKLKRKLIKKVQKEPMKFDINIIIKCDDPNQGDPKIIIK